MTAQPPIWSRWRKSRTGVARRKKGLGGPFKPAQEEQRLNARAIAAARDSRQGEWTDWVIVTLPVEHPRLIADLICNLTPAEAQLRPLRLHDLVERHRVEVPHCQSCPLSRLRVACQTRALRPVDRPRGDFELTY